MITLILSIVCSVAVSVLLKMARTRQVDVAQAIAMNYVVATILCLVLFRPTPTALLASDTPWWVLGALGLLLPTIFLAMAAAVREAGIVLSDAAQRLSLFIPLIASFLIFGEALSINKAGGIIVALAALVLLLMRGSDNRESSDNASGKAVLYLLCVWVGYGVIDVLFKQLARSGAAFSSSLLVAFILAGAVIFSWLIITRTRWHLPSLKDGIVLGLLNFGNIYFYVRAHQQFPENPTLVFSAMNIGVISAGTLIGAGFFKERLSIFNVFGILFAVAAIVLLIPR